MSPVSVSWSWETSNTEDLAFLLSRQTPSVVIVFLNPGERQLQPIPVGIDLQARNSAAKLMHV
jgi:hypothetical protein